jgi:hypothetical protein
MEDSCNVAMTRAADNQTEYLATAKKYSLQTSVIRFKVENEEEAALPPGVAARARSPAFFGVCFELCTRDSALFSFGFQSGAEPLSHSC